ncbi:MAG TPA: hypothetical protein DHU76_03480 [Ruminococcus sp.]|jgi:hypothetical protein|uniref:hypothetical protein n=1 Tax=Ruminococcus callidus TaxID=40519 RepID=UPI000EC56959|nr:hypothetical protein [Ruminococcus sp.]
MKFLGRTTKKSGNSVRVLMLILSKFQKKLDFPLVLWYDRNNALQAETFSYRKTAEKAGTFPVERNEHGEKAIL